MVLPTAHFPVVSRIPASDGRRVNGHAIACSRCNIEEFYKIGPGGAVPPNQIEAVWNKKGWDVDRKGDNHRCPSCVAAANAERRASREQNRFQHKSEEITMTTQAQTPTPAASSLMVELYLHLGDAYDPVNKCYRPGHTDASIAAKLGMAEALVAKRREADFGPIVRDTFIDDIRKELASIESSRLAIEQSAKIAQDAMQAFLAKVAATLVAMSTHSERLSVMLRKREEASSPGAKLNGKA